MEFDRRAFVRLLSAAMAAPAASIGAAVQPISRSHAKSAVTTPKNVVLMICDDLGYGDLGCYGSAIKTPNIDAMAADGVRFTHHNSAHPICSASRAALMTGRYAQRSHTSGAYFPHSKKGMSLEETTLANLFHNQNVKTKAIGKWHLGDAPDYLPTNRGFDSFFGVPYSDDMQPLPLMRDAQILEEDANRDLLTSQYTKEATDFIDRDGSEPFFLYLAYSYPHDPARASQRFRGRSGLGDYGDSVQEIDWSVGEIAKALKRKAVFSDTLMLFTSDHGPWYQGNPGLLRGRKSSTFEGGFRVPFVARWPAALEKGRVVNQWTSHLDVVPTLSALCKLGDSPNPLDGLNISGTLLDGRKTPDRKAVLYFTPGSSHGNDLHCARKGDWKLRVAQLDGEIYINDWTDGKTSFWLARPELYNVRVDASESYDLAKDHPQLVQDILDDATAQIVTFSEDVTQAFSQLKQNVARITTPPGGAPRPNNHKPLPAWAWEPMDRRGSS